MIGTSAKSSRPSAENHLKSSGDSGKGFDAEVMRNYAWLPIIALRRET